MRCSPALRRPCWAAGTPIGAVSDLHRDLVRRGLKRPPVQAVVKWYNADKGFGFGLALVAPGSVIALAAYAGAGQVDWRWGSRWLSVVRWQSRPASPSPRASPSDGCALPFANRAHRFVGFPVDRSTKGSMTPRGIFLMYTFCLWVKLTERQKLGKPSSELIVRFSTASEVLPSRAAARGRTLIRGSRSSWVTFHRRAHLWPSGVARLATVAPAKPGGALAWMCGSGSGSTSNGSDGKRASAGRTGRSREYPPDLSPRH